MLARIVPVAALLATALLAPAAHANTNIEIVAGNTLSGIGGAPTFTPSAANAQIGADVITAELSAGNDVTLDTTSGFGGTGTITISSAVVATGGATLTLDAGDDITQSAPIQFPGTTIVDSTANDNVTLTNGGNDFGTFGAPGIVSGLHVVDATGVVLGQVDANSSSSITTGGPITQTGPLAVSGFVTLAAGAANDVTLDNAGNQASGLQVDSGDDVVFVDSASNLTLTDIDVSGDLTVTTVGIMGQPAATTATVDGTASLSGTSITVAQTTNDFATLALTTSGNANVRDANALDLGTSTVGGTLGVTAGGALTQSGAATATGTTTLSAPSVVLSNVANNFSTVATSTSGGASLRDAGALVLGTTTVGGALSVVAGGALTQSGVLTITGNAGLSAPGITLTNAANDFPAVLLSSSGNASIRDAGALVLTLSAISGDLNITAGGALTQSGATSVGGTATLTAPSVAFTNAASDWGTVALTTTGDATIRDFAGLVLGASTVGGNFAPTAGGALTQSGALMVAGTTTATGEPVSLDHAGNDFAGAVSVASTGTGAAALADANDLTLDSGSAGGAFTATAGDDLTIPAGEAFAATGALTLVADNASGVSPAVGTGGITVGAGAALSGSGAIRLYAATRADNAIDPTATLNGTTFAPGTLGVGSAREQWGVYATAGTATAPFTFFYKDAPADPTPVVTAPVAPPPAVEEPPPVVPPAVAEIAALRPADATGNTVRFPFDVSGAGVLEVLVVHGRAGRLALRTIAVPPGFVALARGTVTTTAAGTVAVPIRLTRRARRILRRNERRLGVAVVAVFTPAAGAPTTVTSFYTFRQVRRGGRWTLRLTGLRPTG